MAAFAGLGTLIRHLPDHPLHHLILTSRIGRHEQACLLCEVEHDRARFKYRERPIAIFWGMIHQSWHAVVGVDGEKFIGKLISLTNVALDHIVIQSALF